MKTLTEVYAVPRANTGGIDAWTNLQVLHGKPVVEKPETLISNWLEVRRLPEAIYYLPPMEARVHRDAIGLYAKTDYGDGFLTCQRVGSKGRLSKMTNEYLEGGWPQLGIKTEDARRLFTALANQALGKLFDLKGLQNYTMADGHANWWMGKGLPDSRVGFRWTNLVGSRQLQGHSSKRGVYWHFGVSTAFRSKPFTHVRVKSRLLFTEDGIAPVKSRLRMQKLRRSFAKGWRNARWRDMMLAFLYWLGEGTTVLNVPFGDDEDLVLSLPPLAFNSPVSISDATAADDDADDPEIEYADEDENTTDDEAEDDGEA